MVFFFLVVFKEISGLLFGGNSVVFLIYNKIMMGLWVVYVFILYMGGGGLFLVKDIFG